MVLDLKKHIFYNIFKLNFFIKSTKIDLIIQDYMEASKPKWVNPVLKTIGVNTRMTKEDKEKQE